MKIRKGFVSNSSSSSFIIDLRDLDKETIGKVVGFENLIKCKHTTDGIVFDGLGLEDKTQSKDPFIQNLSDEEFKAANQLLGHEEWTMKPHLKDPNVLFAETHMDNCLFHKWCDVLGLSEERKVLLSAEYEGVHPRLVNPYMTISDLDEFIESLKYKNNNIGCYLDLRENIDYKKSKLINHLEEAFNLPGTNHFFIPREWETYQSWNIEAHPDNKDIFLCWSSTKNDFPFIDWCFHIGIKPRDVYFYKYYKEKPPILAISDIEDRKFERMY